MSVTKPPIFTPIEDIEISYSRPVSEEVVRKMIQNVTMLSELSLIGSIRPVQINIPGCPVPNAKILQACIGIEITNADSPLKTVPPDTHFTPDLRDRYLRGAPDDTANPMGGSPTVNLSHTHSTGNAGGGFNVGEEGDERMDSPGHTHAINPDLSASEPLNPAHQKVVFYLKIN